MTCVATDGKTMVADGMEVMGDVLSRTAKPKLFYAKDGSVVGCSGESAAIELVKMWFARGEPEGKTVIFPDNDDKESPFHALILRHGGKVQWMDWHFAPIDCDVPACIGSGWDYARAAMKMGKTPREAVEFAAENIVSVGGEITELAPKRVARKTKRKR